MDIEVSEADKHKALEALRKDVKDFIAVEATHLAANKRILNWLKWMMMILLFLFLVTIGVVTYLFVKPPPATVVDLNHIKAENETLIARMKLFEYQKQDFQKEKEIFVKLKQVTDSDLQHRRQDIVKMMARIYAQDSLSKLKVNTVNTKSIKTVNANNVNIIKK